MYDKNTNNIWIVVQAMKCHNIIKRSTFKYDTSVIDNKKRESEVGGTGYMLPIVQHNAPLGLRNHIGCSLQPSLARKITTFNPNN